MRTDAENILSDELIWEEERENHLFLEFDFFLNEIIEKMSSSKFQTELVHSRKIEHYLFKFQTTTKSMTQIDQQMQIKTVSSIVTLISTHTIIHIFSTSDILRASMRRTITSSCVVVMQQKEEISVSKSHWFIVFNHWTLTSQYKNHFYWISIVFHTTVLSVNSTSHVTIWNSISTASSRVCECVSEVSLETLMFLKADRCENEKRENATWIISKSERIMNSTIMITADISHKWKKSTVRSTSMTDRIKTVASTSSERSFVTNVSCTSRLLSIKNKADSIRERRCESETEDFLFLLIVVCTMFNR